MSQKSTVESLDHRLTVVEQTYVNKEAHDMWLTAIHERFNEHDQRFDEVDERFDAIDRRFEEVDARFEQAERQNAQRYDDIMTVLDNLQHRLVKIDDDHVAMIQWLKRHEERLDALEAK